MTKHEFGGKWTLIKLDLLERYLTFFNTALQRQPKPENPFDRVYIDAFAGTGFCDIKVNGGERLAVKGSAKIPLRVNSKRQVYSNKAKEYLYSSTVRRHRNIKHVNNPWRLF